MSALAIALIVLAVLILVMLLGGLAVARRRVNRPGWEANIEAADQALEQARASDRGWDRDLLHAAARLALEQHRPGFEAESLDLVLVDDRPGMADDRAHLMAVRRGESVRVILARDSAGQWSVEHVS
jgi:hypothetical protein